MSAENRLEKIDDARLRSEATRRRLMTTAFSVLGSILCFVVAFWVKESGTAMGGLIALGIAMACNLSLIIGLFRWMSAPAKEIAKRRKKTVLRMLGTEPQSEA